MDPYKSVYGINFDVATELLRLTGDFFSANVCSCLERKRANKAAVKTSAEIGSSILYAHYGRDEAITSTCHVQCAFAPNRVETAEHLSKLTGQTTVVKEQVTTSGRGWSTNVSRSTHEVSRPLLTPDEAMRMKGARKDAHGMITQAGNMIVYVAGYPAIMGLQPLYFKDPELARRARLATQSTEAKKSPTLANASG
jgi:type IV secretory pathway TraG/TraD family ATPase VirD4